MEQKVVKLVKTRAEAKGGVWRGGTESGGCWGGVERLMKGMKCGASEAVLGVY